MPQWATFAGFAFVVTAGLLLLAHATRGVIDGDTDGFDGGADGSAPAPASDTEVGDAPDDGGEPTTETVTLPRSGTECRVTDARTDRQPDGPADTGATDATSAEPNLSTASLLANVAVSQGLFGALLLAGAWYAEIPAWAFGADPSAVGGRAVALGVGLGVALYAANEAGAAAGARFGLGEGERLRSALAPGTRLGWAALLLVVLPVIAGFEEVLFRGALVGVVAAGYDVSPWVLAIVSSGAFALGHGAQGRLGVVVTGTLGFVLAAAFIVTESLLVVVVAHYLVNALEFVVHEGLGVEWTGGAG
ncbi:CPBP family glutamic-type intramembrane protease [Halobellus sp. GM3]|uniref:CPBP family glutamic-type intramembrane protease n=1 Tax=Halobellus sp. GM3 TaxID=3458410 RepID=UPI00403E164C